VGTTSGTNWSRGTTRTTTVSQQHSQGRGQTLRPVLEIMPTQGYSLDELAYLASVRLAQLPRGQCVVKIGLRPSVSLRTVHVKDGWARPEHVDRVVAELADATPYVATVTEALAAQRQRRRALTIEIASTGTDTALGIGAPGEAPEPPPFEEPKWG
jgi:hypothetical protein